MINEVIMEYSSKLQQTPMLIKRIELVMLLVQIIIIMFLLKQEKQNTPLTYDQTLLDVKVSHGRSQLQEVRVLHSWSSQSIKWRLPKIKCQWFNKTDNSMELIAGVEEEYYQPSIVDVGTSIYIQIVPESKDLEYEGMPITRSIGPIQLASETQEQASQLFNAGKSTFFIELKEIFVKQLTDEEQEPIEGKVPIKECLLKITNNKISLTGRTKSLQKSQVLLSSEIGSEYPQLQIDRNCGRFLNVLFNAEEFAIIILQNNKIRDVFYLLVKMLQEKNSTEKVEIAEKIVLKEPQPVTITEQDNDQKSENTRKSQESLPLSPQTIQAKPNDSANIIVISQLRSKLCKAENQAARANKEVESYRAKWQLAQNIAETLAKESEIANERLKRLEQQLKSEQESMIKEQQGICYLKNQCRILQQRHQSLSREQSKLRQIISKLELSTRLTQEQKIKFGDYSNLKLQEALQTILQRDHQLQQRRMKMSYLQTQIEKYQEEIATIRTQLQEKQAENMHLSRKIESLSEAQNNIKDTSSKEKKEEIQSLNFQLSKLKEELLMQKKEQELLQREKESIKLQVRELIQQNTGWRSKQKSSKHQLKLQVVELKKLVNRFTEMITDKDMEINNLKVANKTLNQALLQAKK